MKFNTFFIMLFLVNPLLIMASVAEQQPGVTPVVKVYEAYVIVPLATINQASLFLTLVNTAEKPMEIIAVSSNVAEQVFIVKDQQGRGIKTLTTLMVPPTHQLQLNKDSTYLLLKGLKRQFRTGDELHFELRFADKSSISFTAKAKSEFDQPHHH